MSDVWRKARAVARLGALVAYAGPLLLLQRFVAGPLLANREFIPRILKRGMHKVAGIKVTFNGTAGGGKPTLFAANHMSYLDIIMLGGYLPGAFVAKKEVRGWPVIGWASKLTGTVFTERRVGTLRREQGQIVETLNSGRNVILFPEATTGNGRGLLPFKRGLLCAAFNNLSRVKIEKEVQVQPVSLRLTHVNGKPVAGDLELLDRYVWIGGRSIAAHFWNLAQTASMDIEITAHAPVNPRDYSDSRAFTRAVEDKVRHGYSAPPIRP